MELNSIPIRQTQWHPCYRIIPSRFPPIHLFERVTNADEFDAIYEIEQFTNPRLTLDIQLLPREERIFGDGTSFIMAAFTHIPINGSRFTDGSFGVYYAGRTIETAIEETKFHREKFLKDSNLPPIELDMRVILSNLTADLHDISDENKLKMSAIYHPDDYSASQILAKKLRLDGRASFGIKYDSVRHNSGECVAIFRPKALSNCRQEKHLCYVWNGSEIVNIYTKMLGF